MAVEIIERLEDLCAISRDWRRLAQPFATPLMQFEWFHACAAALADPTALKVVVVRAGGEIAAIAPLILTVRNAVPTLSCLGDRLGEPCGFLYRNPDALKQLTSAVASLAVPVRLNRIPADVLFEESLQSNRPAIFPLVRRHSHSLFVPACGSWRDFEAGLAKSRRKAFRQNRKKLEAHGALAIDAVSPTAEAGADALEEAFAVESSGWKSRNGTAVLGNEQNFAFFSRYCRSAAESGSLRLFFLRLDGKAIAVRIAVERRGRLWGLKIGYDENYRQCAPGLLLSHETIRYVFERGLDAYEFLGLEEDWQHIWPVERHTYLSYRLYPLSKNGARALCTDALHSCGRAASGRIKRMTDDRRQP